jgi:hypothetical protein
VNATLSCQGNVTFALAGKEEEKNGVDGTITVEAGGALTVDAGDGIFTLTDSDANTNTDATDELGTATPTTTCRPSAKPTRNHLSLTGNDFALSSDGKRGTLVTYLPQGTTHLQQSMPVPVIAVRDSKVSLRTIFFQSFGTSSPRFYSIKLLPPADPRNTKRDWKYWGVSAKSSLQLPPAWFVNGKPITKKQHVTDTDNVELRVGNNISSPAQFEAQVTRAGSGPESEVVTYSVWTVDPAVARGVESMPGKPTTADIVASAHSLDKTFPDVPNTNLCNSNS